MVWLQFSKRRLCDEKNALSARIGATYSKHGELPPVPSLVTTRALLQLLLLQEDRLHFLALGASCSSGTRFCL